ncbi:M56 family metallopeptidase [Croceiramulus getboli]|nr:M56 family metallopeptidase [Flavobacteriaceae bacterium YJPT1-3]
MDYLVLLAKSALLLAVFYAVYMVFLKRETFFTVYRHLFLIGLVACLALPFLNYTVTETVMLESRTQDYVSDFLEVQLQTESIAPEESWEWPQLLLAIYLIGFSIMILRLAYQCWGIFQLIRNTEHKYENGFAYVPLDGPQTPFSFFYYIFYNPRLHSESDLNMMLQHERVHAREGHTVDVLLMQVVLAIQWFNPLAWTYRKALEQNLEFIADAKAIARVDSAKAYQHTLLKTSTVSLTPALTTNFYHSLIKKRIVMLNKQSSKPQKLWRLGILLPVLGLFFYSFSLQKEVRYTYATPLAHEALSNATPARNVDTEAAADLPTNNPVRTLSQPISLEVTPSTYAVQEQSGPFSITITKTTTRKELEEIKTKLLEKHNVDFQYSNLKYNSAGEIISLSVKYKDKESGNSGQLNLSSDGPIADFLLTRNEKGAFFSGTGKPRDLEMMRAEREQMMQDRRAEMQVRREAMEQKRQEMRVARGAVRQSMERDSLREEQRALMETRRQEMREKREQMKERMKGYRRDSSSTVARNYAYTIQRGKADQVKIRPNSQGTAVYYLNGKKVDENQLSDIDPNEIAMVNVYKGDQATEYTKDTVAGVIAIRTKNNAAVVGNTTNGYAYTIHGSSRITVTKNTSDAELQAMKEQLAAKNIDFSYKRVRRNAAGEIIGIKVTLVDGEGSKRQISTQGSDEPIQPIRIH